MESYRIRVTGEYIDVCGKVPVGKHLDALVEFAKAHGFDICDAALAEAWGANLVFVNRGTGAIVRKRWNITPPKFQLGDIVQYRRRPDVRWSPPMRVERSFSLPREPWINRYRLVGIGGSKRIQRFVAENEIRKVDET